MKSLLSSFVVLAGMANTGLAADVGLAPPIFGLDDPPACHWSGSISIVIIARDCGFKVGQPLLDHMNIVSQRLEDYVRRNSGAPASEIDRQRKVIEELTRANLKFDANGRCIPDDWLRRMFPVDMDLSNVKPETTKIDAYLAVERPARLEPCD